MYPTGTGGADAKRGKVKEGKGARKGGPEVPLESPRSEPVETANPLVEVMVEEEEGGRLMMPGNMALVHLTLACECLPNVHDAVLAACMATTKSI